MNMVTASKQATKELDGIVITGINAAQAEYEQEYRALVLEMALTDQMDTKKVREVLIATGRPIDDLKRHLATAQARLAASKNLEELSAHRAAIAKLKPGLAEAIQGREELIQGYRQAVEAADSVIRELQTLESTHQKEMQSIRSNTATTLWQTRSRSIDAELLRLSGEERGLEGELKEYRRLLANLTSDRATQTMSVSNRDKLTLSEALLKKRQLESRIQFLMQSDPPKQRSAKEEFERKLAIVQDELAEAEAVIAEAKGLEDRIHACQERLEAVRAERERVKESATDWRNFDFD